ncbi:diaminopimelate decarboxylase [Geitlerinema sp. PCC 9228]|jgi:diaminopimelate decarboxylase|uniref:diaminopimelate decarboxylase n=1 Tax=Geitlerinema sp. PCC 9228 TaxID=111611 RepID=UPI0008F9898A|nr:diaminopimelate decarboxylase [Geitlerinema sp. PCC 9228]
MVVSPSAGVDNTARQYLANLPADPNDANAPSVNQNLLPLTAKVNDRDTLEIGGCDVATLVAQFGSPLFILDETSLRTACRQYYQTFQQHYEGPFQILYASKAWSCLAIATIVASEGLGMDVVSAGELHTAVQAGMVPEKIYLHGNNKSQLELEYAIEVGCTIVVDNWWELRTLQELARDRENVPVMLRFTPGIECHTHEYIRTGHIDSKFGFDPDSLDGVLQALQEAPQLRCVGFHAHIGSQIFELQPHQDLTKILVQWYQKAQQAGLPVSEINVGGGLGICHTEAEHPPKIQQWVQVVCEGIQNACREANIDLPKLLCEPGRSLIGTTCVTAYTVGSSKEVPGIRKYIAVDGGMSDNARPITYGSEYRAAIANRMSVPANETVTIAGKHCESGDILIADARLPASEPGDVLVVMGTGAYNYSMASNYNRIPRPAAVLVNNGEANTILQRETYQDLLRQDRLPQRLIAPSQ